VRRLLAWAKTAGALTVVSLIVAGAVWGFVDDRVSFGLGVAAGVLVSSLLLALAWMLALGAPPARWAKLFYALLGGGVVGVAWSIRARLWRFLDPRWDWVLDLFR
jgi:hypothetical protein